ncbi:MAG: hypothetical protein JO265_04810 [Acidimicrobiia bacterium]|nr:hypothetical protein [Acidimicrobiia bacterium]
MYQIDGRGLLFDWLAAEPDPDRRRLLLDALQALAENPLADAERVPGVRAPVYVTVLPLTPPVALTFLLAEQFRTIRLIRIGTPH